MKVDVLMPRLGESVTEGTIVKWWKKPGDYVKKEETLLEVSTDKVDSEIPSPEEGVLVELIAQENDTIEVDNVIAIIDTNASAEAEVETETTVAGDQDQAEEEVETEESAKVKSEAEISADSENIINIEMPQLGESVTEGTIVKWWKQAGDAVKKEETLLEISTDKVDTEIPSPFEGTIIEILAKENETVEVGKPIAKIQTKDVHAISREDVSSTPVDERDHQPAAKPLVEESQKSAGNKVAEGLTRKKGGRFFSPLVLNIARKEGIAMSELESISGSGVDNRVTKKDILNYIETRTAERPAAPTVEAPPQPRPAAATGALPSTEEVRQKWQGKEVEIIPMENVRKRIAEHMVTSKQTSPHVYGVAECDFSKVMYLVDQHRESFQKREGFKLTVNPFILYALIKAVRDFPGVNSSVEGQHIIQKNFLNVGMAVATDRGLIVPVLKNAHRLNFVGIAQNAYDLAIRTRESKLSVDDVQDSTITVTNYGVFGNIIGFPIINQPNVAIMGVGAIKKRPVVIETEQGDMLGIRSMGFLSLSYDHRIVDGELGDKFLQRVNYYLQNFEEEWM